MSWVAKALILCIRGYQRCISPVLVALIGPSCRFEPSCSQYAIDALRVHGVFRGTFYAVWRVLRCHPFARGGNDPVPPAAHAHNKAPDKPAH